MTEVRHVLQLLYALNRQDPSPERGAPDQRGISPAIMFEALSDNAFDLSSAIVSTYHDA